MTPDGHATEAEKLVAQAAACAGEDTSRAMYFLAKAQVHATLSLRPPSREPGFVPRHETLSGADLALPADDPNADGDYAPGS